MMMMPQNVRKFMLTLHVISSVGWFGAVLAFLILALTGLNSTTAASVQASYIAMDLIAWFVILPLSLAALITGLVQAWGTTWGLLRHYWVIIKLIITVLAIILLLVHMQPISLIAAAVTERTLTATDLRPVRLQLVFDAVAALGALTITIVLSIYKPRGMTKYGLRKSKKQQQLSQVEQ